MRSIQKIFFWVITCCGMSVTFFQNSELNPQVDGIGKGDTWETIGSWGSGFVNGINTHNRIGGKQATPFTVPSHLPCADTAFLFSRRGSLGSRDQALSRQQAMAATLILNTSASRTMKNKSPLFINYQSVLFCFGSRNCPRHPVYWSPSVATMNYCIFDDLKQGKLSLMIMD